MSDPTWRYLLSLKVDDHTQSRWLTAFGDAGDVLIGASAAQVQALGDGEDPAFSALIHVGWGGVAGVRGGLRVEGRWGGVGGGELFVCVCVLLGAWSRESLLVSRDISASMLPVILSTTSNRNQLASTRINQSTHPTNRNQPTGPQLPLLLVQAQGG